MQARKKVKKRKEKEKKPPQNTRCAEDYSEMAHMGASREARGLEWGFTSHIVPE